jgi:hypothetical protein
MWSVLKKIYMLAFLALLLLQFIAFNTNSVSASSDEIVNLDLLVNILEIDTRTNLANIRISVSTNNFPTNYDQLNVDIFGGGFAYIECENAGSNGINGWRFQGESEQTSWLLEGTGENYPFNSYTLRFRIDSLTDVGGNFTLEQVGAIFIGPNYISMRNTWKTENVTLLPIAGTPTNEVVFTLEKSQDRLINDVLYSLAPILGCYYLLGATLILNPKDDLNARLRIYLSLFVFSSTFLFALQSFLPFHSSITFPEMLLSNLTVSTAIFTIFSIIANKVNNPWNLREKMGFYSKSDSVGLIFALLVFLIFYGVTLFGKLNLVTATVFTYVITPSYVYAVLFNSPKRKITKHKLKWTIFLILVLFPLELVLFVRLITFMGIN